MTTYFLDIETKSKEEGVIDVETDEIVSIQYIPFYDDSGKPSGNMKILGTWQSGEKEAVWIRCHYSWISREDFSLLHRAVDLDGLGRLRAAHRALFVHVPRTRPTGPWAGNAIRLKFH